jgi:hypothetical protein
VSGNKQIYNSNCIQQFNYGTEKGFEKVFFSSLLIHTTNINVGNEKSSVVKIMMNLKPFFNYFDIMFYHMSSFILQKTKNILVFLYFSLETKANLLTNHPLRSLPFPGKSLFKDFQTNNPCNLQHEGVN